MWKKFSRADGNCYRQKDIRRAGRRFVAILWQVWLWSISPPVPTIYLSLGDKELNNCSVFFNYNILYTLARNRYLLKEGMVDGNQNHETEMTPLSEQTPDASSELESRLRTPRQPVVPQHTAMWHAFSILWQQNGMIRILSFKSQQLICLVRRCGHFCILVVEVFATFYKLLKCSFAGFRENFFKL